MTKEVHVKVGFGPVAKITFRALCAIANGVAKVAGTCTDLRSDVDGLTRKVVGLSDYADDIEGHLEWLRSENARLRVKLKRMHRAAAPDDAAEARVMKALDAGVTFIQSADVLSLIGELRSLRYRLDRLGNVEIDQALCCTGNARLVVFADALAEAALDIHTVEPGKYIASCLVCARQATGSAGVEPQHTDDCARAAYLAAREEERRARKELP